jgi:dTDP-4-amino-4,6-dideoxygalactose transaminase
MTSVQLVAQELGLKVVEDAAQAHGAMHGGRRIGAHSDAVCWSFYPGKNLGALGDGGAVTTNDANLADLMRMVSNYGSRKKYEHSVIGVNSRLDEVQAAILRVKLSRLTEWNTRRADIASEYFRELSDTCVTLPYVAEGAVPAWHLFVVKVRNRELVQKRLRDIGVETLIHYPIPCHQQRAFSGRQWPSMPTSETLATEILSLPIGPHTDLSVCAAVANLLRREF